MNSRFLDDLERGKYGEYLFQRYLQLKGIPVQEAPDEEFPYYDVMTIIKGTKQTYEVKTDSSIQETGNVYIEFLNINRNNLSGIFTSLANFYVYINEKTLEGHIFNRSKLLTYIYNNRLTTVRSKVDNQNALGWLLPLKDLFTSDAYLKTIDLNGIE